MKRHIAIIALLTLCFTTALHAEDWPSFRGPRGNGISSERSAPTTWDANKNIKWKTALPGPGNSSPIVSKGRVFLTCAQDKGKTRSLYCFDRNSGKELWVRSVQVDEVEPTHSTNPYSASSPAADGQRVVVWHGTGGVLCYDYEGNQIWKADLGKFEHMWGYAASPVIHKGQVILNAGPGKRVFMTALDLATGKSNWKTPIDFTGDGQKRADGGPVGTFATPVIITRDGQDQIICPTSSHLIAYDPANGKVIWSADGLQGAKGDVAYSSPIIADDLCIYLAGYGGPGLAIKLGGKGDVTTSHRVWRQDSVLQSIGSGVYVNGYLYNPTASSGTMQCIDPRTGEEMWKDRDKGGAHWGSITAVGDILYVTAQSGSTLVFKATPKAFEPIALNDLGEKSNATPAVSGGQIFIRTNEHLYCIADNSQN